MLKNRKTEAPIGPKQVEAMVKQNRVNEVRALFPCTPSEIPEGRLQLVIEFLKKSKRKSDYSVGRTARATVVISTFSDGRRSSRS